LRRKEGECSERTHRLDDLGVGLVLGDDLAHLGEVPSVPLLNPHRVDVDLLVQVVKESDRLNDHSVDLVGRELELVAGEGVGETEFHRREVARVDVAEQGVELLADTTVEVVDGRAGDDVELKLLGDGTTYKGKEQSQKKGRKGRNRKSTVTHQAWARRRRASRS
jgi:hypothetical protein